MFAVRSFLSTSSVVLATVAMAGCYDLSAPSGPHRDAFVRDKSPTQTQEQGQTSADPAGEPDPSAANDADGSDEVENRVRSQLRIVPDEAD